MLYLSDPFNVFDAIRSIILIFYALYSIIAEDETGRKELLTLLNFISWIRLMSYLRLFKQTRIFIAIMKGILIDMIPFNIVLGFTLLGFTLCHYVLNVENEEIDLTYSIKHNYRLMFGDFETDDYETGDY